MTWINENGNGSDVIESNVDYFYTTTYLRHDVSLDRIATILRAAKTTGVLTVHLNDGGIRRVELSERTPVPTERKSDQIRKILKMD